jgi:hypothetical protein
MTAPARPPIVAVRAASHVMFAAALLAPGACASTTLFQSSFNSQPLYKPPTAQQLVGTMQVVAGDSAAVLVEPTQVHGSPDNWLHISRELRVPNTNNATPPSIAQGMLAQTFSTGNYGFLGVFDIGSGDGLISVDFVANPQGLTAESFLHLDFLQDGRVRFDDDPSVTCCHYGIDTTFTLSVSIQVMDTAAVAHVTLLGQGQGVSPGTFDYPIKHPNFARQFSAFRVWMGYPWTGAFVVTDLLVTRHN